MDRLKRSLEHAIKELQEMPAPARPIPPVRQHSAPVQRRHSAPATRSIEAALASAPSVSPHYVPPAPPPPKPPLPRPPVQDVRSARPLVLNQKPNLQTNFAPKPPIGTAIARSQAPLPARKNMPAPKNLALPADGSGKGVNLENVADLADEVAVKAKKLRDYTWRWATIGISCAGGLASGWLGSNVSDPANGIFTSNVQSIVGKVSENIERKALPPVSLKLARTGLSDRNAPDSPIQMAGKPGGTFQTDENLCTVLALHGGTGLTLAKPCKPVKTTDIESTLGKADLFETPQ